MKIYSLDVLLFQFGTSMLFHVQFELLLPDLHTDFSRGRSGGLVFPSLSEFSTVYCDPHSQRLFISSNVLNQCSLLFPPLELKCVNVEMRGGNFTKKQRYFFPNSQGKESICKEKLVLCDKYAEWLANPTPTYMYICSACLTLCDPIDCNSLGSSVHWILWVKILEWVAISYSRGSS